MRKEFAALKREFAELQAQARAQLCTCGKTSSIPILNYAFPKTCAEERELEARRSLKPERCPAMHPDGDAVPLDISFTMSFCADAQCECHKAPDHAACPTCDPDYFKQCVTPPRAEEPEWQLIPARPETPARDVIAVMRPVARSTPKLPARSKQRLAPSTPAELYGRDPAYLPDCECGHRAAMHREVAQEANCMNCGLPDGDHAHDDVIVLSGPRPCRFRHPFPGCSTVTVIGAGPCDCKAYAAREAA